jgi:hypothetical protein
MRITTADHDRFIIFDADGENDKTPYAHPWAVIYAFDTQTGALDRLSPDSVYAAAPFVAPDGLIYFEGFEAKDIPKAVGEDEPVVELYIYSMRLDGSGLQRICKGSRPTIR